jgi:hypothetical protein
MGRAHSSLQLSDRELQSARRIEEVLQAAEVLYERSDMERNSEEPYVRFEVRTSAELELRVELIVHGDVFVIRANGAEVRIESTAYGDGGDEEWLRDSIAMLTYLITHDLRLKTRRGLLGGRTGAIYFGSAKAQGGWSGELLAVWWGKEREYHNWLERRVT